MSPLLRKEIRMLLPAWILAMVLAIVPVWFVWPDETHSFVLTAPGLVVFVPFWLGVCLVALTVFGQELNLGTFSLLLAQPVSRRRL